jgi:hypothetical protein
MTWLIISGAAIWTAVIAKDSFVESVKVQGGTPLGIQVNAGGTLCESFQWSRVLGLIVDLTWVSFALMTLAVIPYVIACCTYRSK